MGPDEAQEGWVEVALGVVFDGEKVLICRRKKETVLGGYWEFPGGKREPGETLENCVRREVREEVGLEVEVLGKLPAISHEYPHARVRLQPFVCRATRGNAQCLAVAEVRWIVPAAIGSYTFPAANGALVALVSRGWQAVAGEMRKA